MNQLPPQVLRARMQLMLAHPYLACALARLPVINAANLPWCKTMATDGYYVYVNPSFCEPLPEEEITGVFAHEVLHCVLGHIDRRGERERRLWNVAIDFATNLLLTDFGFKLPAGALLDARFRGLTAEQIYQQLRSSGVTFGEGFDLHVEPGDAEGSVERDRDFPSADERRRLRAAVMREMAKERARRQGTWPGELQREFALATSRSVPWQDLLAQFFSDLRRTDYRTYPFNRKHLWRGIYLPSAGVPGPDHVVLAVDTSGSVSQRELGQFVTELDRLRGFTDCKLTLLHCDARVQKVDVTEGRDASVLPAGTALKGGGGTDFRPVFDWVRDQLAHGEAAPDALIYCTDGYGTFPPQAPAYPVVWVVTARSAATFPWGRTIKLEDGG
jgi:predicted metal-dependent peptidase